MLERQHWRNFLGVTFSVALLGVGLGSTFPLAALALNARGYGPDVIGYMMAVDSVGGLIGTLLAPFAAARLGRRGAMLACLSLAGASIVGLQFAQSLWLWALLLMLFGVAASPLFVIGEAWISLLPADAVRGRVVAIYTTSFSFCQVFGPPLTSALESAPHWAFIVCGGVFLLGVPGLLLARADEDQHGAGHVAAAGAAKTTGASWAAVARAAPAILAGTAFFAAFDTVVLSFLPLFALDHGLSRAGALNAVTIVLLGDAMMQFAAGWLADRHGRARVHVLSGVALCLLLPLLPASVRVPGLWATELFVLGGLAGSVYTLAIVASGDSFRGAALLRASGLIALTWSASSSVVPALTGWLMRHWGTAAIGTALWCMALVFTLAARRELGLQRSANKHLNGAPTPLASRDSEQEFSK